MSGVWSLQLLINDYIMNFPSIIKSCGSEHYPGQLKTLSKFWLICSQSSILNVWQLHWHFRAAKICECLYFGIMTMKQLFFLFFFFNIGYCENWNKLRVKIFLYCAYMFAYIYIRENCMHTQTVLYKYTSMYIYQYVNTCMFIHMQLCVCAIYIMFIYTVSWRLHLLFRRLNCKIEFFRNLIL